MDRNSDKRRKTETQIDIDEAETEIVSIHVLKDDPYHVFGELS